MSSVINEERSREVRRPNRIKKRPTEKRKWGKNFEVKLSTFHEFGFTFGDFSATGWAVFDSTSLW